MSNLPTLITDLALILATAAVAIIICKKLNQPLVLGYLIAGFLAGPNFVFFPTIANHDNISVWGEIGVIFLLFSLGLSFTFDKIKSVGHTAIIAVCTETVAFFFLGYLCATILGWPFKDKILWGFLLCMSSTAIVMKAFSDLHLQQDKYANIVLGLLIMEDLVGIILMTVMSTMSVSGEGIVSGFTVLKSIASLLFFLALWGLLGIYLLPSFFRKFAAYMSDEVLLLSSLGLCLCMVVVCAALDFSSALGAFITGSLIAACTSQAEKLKNLVQPIECLFSAIFFISIGMMIRPSDLSTYALPILLSVFFVYLGKTVFTSLGVLVSGHTLKAAMFTGFSLTQVGEFSLIAAAVGSNLGVLSDQLYPIVVAVCVITTFTTPYFIKLSNPCHAFLLRHLPLRLTKITERYTSDARDATGKNVLWQELLGAYFKTMGIYLVLCCTIAGIALLWLMPWCRANVSPIFGTYLAGLITLVALSPFLRLLMLRNKKITPYITTLWFQKRTTHFPILFLLGLRLFLAMGFIFFTLTYIFLFSTLFSFVLTLLITFFISSSDWLLEQSLKMEVRFVVNLNTVHEEKNKSQIGQGNTLHQLNDMLFFRTYRLEPASPLANKTLRELALRERYSFNILEIKTGTNIIDIPGPEDMLKPHSEFLILGTLAQFAALDTANTSLNYKLQALDKPLALKTYLESRAQNCDDESCFLPCVIVINSNSPLIKKTLRSTSLRQKWHCTVIGLERSGYAFDKPDISLPLEQGDLLWLIGKQQMLNALIKEGIL